jgi:hypothetical protein
MKNDSMETNQVNGHRHFGFGCTTDVDEPNEYNLIAYHEKRIHNGLLTTIERKLPRDNHKLTRRATNETID